MNLFRNAKTVRFWAIFSIISFCAQVMGVGAHASISAHASMNNSEFSESSEPCHESMSQVKATVIDEQNPGVVDGILGAIFCCDGDCSMTDCYSNSSIAILNSVKLLLLKHSKFTIFFTPLYSISEPESSFFRPPILG